MAKAKSIFVCQSCGHQSTKWMGKCSHCNEWNTFIEEITSSISAAGEDRILKKSVAQNLADVQPLNQKRIIFH